MKKQPLLDNKHCYYSQINHQDELSIVDELEDIELVGIYHILRVKILHNKGTITLNEAFKYCNAFSNSSQEKVSEVLFKKFDIKDKFFIPKDEIKKEWNRITTKSKSAKASRLKRVTNDTTNEVTNDTTNGGTKEKVKEKEKDIYKGSTLTNLSKDKKTELSDYMKNHIVEKEIDSVEIENFIDYWKSTTKNAIKKDWKAAFRIWCRSDWVKKTKNNEAIWEDVVE